MPTFCESFLPSFLSALTYGIVNRSKPFFPSPPSPCAALRLVWDAIVSSFPTEASSLHPRSLPEGASAEPKHHCETMVSHHVIMTIPSRARSYCCVEIAKVSERTLSKKPGKILLLYIKDGEREIPNKRLNLICAV